MTQLLTVDAGTSSVKVAVFDQAGQMLALSLQEYSLLTPARDRVELPAPVYWRSTAAGIRQVLTHPRVDAGGIAAVGVTSQGETIIPVGADGQPLRDAIVWLDNRAGDQARQVSAAFEVDSFYEVTGLPEIIPTWPACKILWLRENEDHVFSRAHKFLLVEDYLLHRMSGEFATDGGLCTSTGYFDIRSGGWWDQMLGFVDVGPEHLPRLAKAGQTIGRVTKAAADQVGLRSGTPVVTGAMDLIAGTIGAGGITPGIVCETTGTALVLTSLVEDVVYDPGRRVPCYYNALPGSYLLEPYCPTAGMVLRWFRDEFGAGQGYGGLADLASTVGPGSDGLTMLPHLTGSASPKYNPLATGAFYGITLQHTRAHFVRAILEAVAFMVRENVELLDDLGVATRELVSLGGGARSDVWLQIKADVTGLPVRRSECEEAASLGVAILCAVALGLHSDVASACQAMTRSGASFEPSRGSSRAYADAYARYQDLFAALEPMFG